MKKLGVRISGTSIRRVLTEANILPDPDRRAPKGVMTPWRKFLKVHMNVMLACDLFTKDIVTIMGKRTAYVLAFIHLGSRKIFVSPSTYHPTEECVQQQARNVSMWAEDEGIDIDFTLTTVTPNSQESSTTISVAATAGRSEFRHFLLWRIHPSKVG